MEQIIIGGIIAFLTTFYAIPVILQVAHDKKLYDLPDERKIHKEPIPRLGGLAMFIGFLISLMLTVTIDHANACFQYYIVAFLIIFFIGIKDDLVMLSPMKKMVGQVLVAAILAFRGKVVITSMYGFLGLQAIDPMSSYLLTFFTIIVVINAFNLIDGIDGLAGGIALITCSVFGTYFLINNDYAHALLGFTLAGSIAGFLIYNFHPAKIFMGDTGSMLLGVVNVILVIHFIEMAPQYQNFPVHASPAIGFGILLVPLMDTLRVFGIRIFHRRSPFSPDRNHLHHILLDKGFSHKTIAVSVGITTIAFAGLSFVLAPLMGSTMSILCLITLFFAAIYMTTRLKTRIHHMHVVKHSVETAPALEHEEETAQRVKLVSLFSFKERPAAVEEE
ncbi:MraY family glycosyltransferase [Deminuibacter soli]|uniref:Undecaprenyl/decaprenyl-phosphate alpha-N-acetylglucosaminyl 1-phosphate transferase n=1 Tax=Deminuibacter soli TaxID=2291815 RepID=A0A3E1NP75_9BACT|nr:MraY family glycosyltransferase [Deminuibacter soli]RFM29720.1 undecaprenyl/decaprenyl-phosphate alpha-N-acetylglucosaminyl 1-phosphate transferase [Deminuibacter soli]